MSFVFYGQQRETRPTWIVELSSSSMDPPLISASWFSLKMAAVCRRDISISCFVLLIISTPLRHSAEFFELLLSSIDFDPTNHPTDAPSLDNSCSLSFFTLSDLTLLWYRFHSDRVYFSFHTTHLHLRSQIPERITILFHLREFTIVELSYERDADAITSTQSKSTSSISFSMEHISSCMDRSYKLHWTINHTVSLSVAFLSLRLFSSSLFFFCME